MRSDSTIRPSSTDQSRRSSASSGGLGPGPGSSSSQSQSKHAAYPDISFERDTVVSSPVFKHDFAKYTLTVDPPLEERFAWARQASPSPSPQPRSPVSPWCLSNSAVGSSSTSTHRRSTSLTPSDTPSVTFADTPTPPVSPGTRARAQVHGHWQTKLRHVSSSSRDESSVSGSSSCGMQTAGEPSLTTCSTASTSCWSNFDELETRPRWQKGDKETRREKKDRKRWEAEAFSADRTPSLKDLFEAGMCEVIDENGQRTPFRSVVSERRTIIIFIRHCESMNVLCASRREGK